METKGTWSLEECWVLQGDRLQALEQVCLHGSSWGLHVDGLIPTCVLKIPPSRTPPPNHYTG